MRYTQLVAQFATKSVPGGIVIRWPVSSGTGNPTAA
jgi:hypothetical protein